MRDSLRYPRDNFRMGIRPRGDFMDSKILRHPRQVDFRMGILVMAWIFLMVGIFCPLKVIFLKGPIHLKVIFLRGAIPLKAIFLNAGIFLEVAFHLKVIFLEVALQRKVIFHRGALLLKAIFLEWALPLKVRIFLKVRILVKVGIFPKGGLTLKVFFLKRSLTLKVFLLKMEIFHRVEILTRQWEVWDAKNRFRVKVGCLSRLKFRKSKPIPLQRNV